MYCIFTRWQSSKRMCVKYGYSYPFCRTHRYRHPQVPFDSSLCCRSNQHGKHWHWQSIWARRLSRVVRATRYVWPHTQKADISGHQCEEAYLNIKEEKYTLTTIKLETTTKQSQGLPTQHFIVHVKVAIYPNPSLWKSCSIMTICVGREKEEIATQCNSLPKRLTKPIKI